MPLLQINTSILFKNVSDTSGINKRVIPNEILKNSFDFIGAGSRFELETFGL